MSAGRSRVLVVDDDRRLRDLLARFLTENDYRVTAAASAASYRAFLSGRASLPFRVPSAPGSP